MFYMSHGYVGVWHCLFLLWVMCVLCFPLQPTCMFSEDIFSVLNASSVHFSCSFTLFYVFYMKVTLGLTAMPFLIGWMVTDWPCDIFSCATHTTMHNNNIIWSCVIIKWPLEAKDCKIFWRVKGKYLSYVIVFATSYNICLVHKICTSATNVSV